MKILHKTAILFIPAILSFGISSYASDISFMPDIYISDTEFYIENIEPQNLITSVENAYGNLVTRTVIENETGSELTVIGAVMNKDGTLQKTVAKTAPGSCEISLPIGEINSNTGQIKVMVWDNNSNQKAYAPVSVLSNKNDGLTQEERDMELIRQRLISGLKLYNSSTDAQPLLNKLDSSGKFSDIDYSSRDQTDWQVYTALSNAQTMLKAYYSPGNKWEGNQELWNAIELVLRDWAKNQYTSTNWWYQEIKVPEILSEILLYPLPESDYLPTLESLALKGIIKVNESYLHKCDQTGGNLTDKLQTTLKIAAGVNDIDTMRNVVTYLMDNELSIYSHQNNGEGIMPDYSFHQHGCLFYNGSYGHVFCSGTNKILSYLQDTSFMVSDRAINTYADFIIEGHSWLFKGSCSDFSCFGRAISRSNGLGSSIKNNSAEAASLLLGMPGLERRDDLKNLISSRLGESDNGFNGAKHFWTSDVTVFHRPYFYVSVRNSSSRNKNTEYMNSENSKAYYIADGTTVIMREGDEYKGIFPIWDWSLIPGTTTAYMNFNEIPALSEKGTTIFVGGASDGEYAISAMDYQHNSVTAKKSVFLFDKGFTALGAGITGTGNRTVNTTLNQCFQSGSILYSTSNKNTYTLPSNTSQKVDNIQWVLHDRIGYYLPSPESLYISGTKKSGAWYSINTAQSNSLVSGNVFSLYMSHGINPSEQSYEYSVLPEITQSELEKYALNPDMITITNTTKSQAVWSKSAQCAGIVFWTGASSPYLETVTLPSELIGESSDLTITITDPCTMLLRKNSSDNWELTISDPKNGAHISDTSITVNRKWSGTYSQINSDATSTINIPLPDGLYAGSSMTLTFNQL